MNYCTRPIYSTTGCTLDFRINLSASAYGAANAYEFDGMYAILCPDGNVRLFNCSCQYNNGLKVWQVVNAAGEWVSTGITSGVLAPDVDHVIEIVHAFNMTTYTSSVVSITVDGVTGYVPLELQNVLAKITSWLAGFVNVQQQQSSLPAGLEWSMVFCPELQWPN
jgi:hypothetical protein